MRIILLGPPGAGKGTLAGLLVKSTNVTHISTGDILRVEIKNQTDLGVEVKKYLDSGELVPDDVVIRLVQKRLLEKDVNENGYLLDGFPRTREQAEKLDHILKQIQMPLEQVVYMETSEEVILKRLTGRRVCKDCGAVYHLTNRPPTSEGTCDQCGSTNLYQRVDDNEETIRQRLKVYIESTSPTIDYFTEKGLLRKVDGNAESEELQQVILADLDEKKTVDQYQNG